MTDQPTYTVLLVSSSGKPTNIIGRNLWLSQAKQVAAALKEPHSVTGGPSARVAILPE